MAISRPGRTTSRSWPAFRFTSNLALFLALTSLASGCSTLGYLIQAGKGQLALINRAKPIDEVLKDPRTSDRTKALLREIPAVKKFGEENGLKPTTNYTEYVKLDRPVAVWVVSAAEKLHFKSKEWSFPVVGSFPYLGYFDLDGAKAYAKELSDEGWDADVRGARAYSTLGWFRDAVLSTMIPDGDEAMGELVNTVLHESVHATVYISGEAYFNESVAMFVADRLAPIYLEKVKGANAPETTSYVKSNKEYEQKESKFHEAYEKLDSLYRSPKPDSEKLEEKKKIFDQLKTELEIKRDINNATLIQFKEYHVGVAEFTRLFEACGKDFRRFMSTLKNLSRSSFQEPQQTDLGPVINPLSDKGCPAGA